MTVDEKSPHAVSVTKPSDLEFRVERTFDHPIQLVDSPRSPGRT